MVLTDYFDQDRDLLEHKTDTETKTKISRSETETKPRQVSRPPSLKGSARAGGKRESGCLKPTISRP